MNNILGLIILQDKYKIITLLFRYENLVNGAKKYDVDGLNSLHYKLEYLEKKILYTWIVVKIEPEAVNKPIDLL